MKKMAKMLRTHRGLLLNWFRARGQIALGAVEGLNNKAKVTTKRSYGFRSYNLLEIALYHHERWDGTGYPQGLQGEEIPISGRLMAIADVYDALISKRVYKDAYSHEEAVEIVHQSAGSHLDPDIVQAFLELQDEFLSIATQYSDEI